MIIREDGEEPERQSAISRLEAERNFRAQRIIPSDPDFRFRQVWKAILIVAKPTIFGVSLSPDEIEQAQELFLIAQSGVVLELAYDAIKQRIMAMTAVEARAFDPATAPEWP